MRAFSRIPKVRPRVLNTLSMLRTTRSTHKRVRLAQERKPLLRSSRRKTASRYDQLRWTVPPDPLLVPVPDSNPGSAFPKSSLFSATRAALRIDGDGFPQPDHASGSCWIILRDRAFRPSKTTLCRICLFDDALGFDYSAFERSSLIMTFGNPTAISGTTLLRQLEGPKGTARLFFGISNIELFGCIGYKLWSVSDGETGLHNSCEEEPQKPQNEAGGDYERKAIEFIRTELTKAAPTNRNRIIEKFILAALWLYSLGGRIYQRCGDRGRIYSD